MRKTSKVIQNRKGDYYAHDKKFDKAKWMSIVDIYFEEVDSCELLPKASWPHGKIVV